MSVRVLSAGRVVTGHAVLEPGWIRVDGDRIDAVGAGEPPAHPDTGTGTSPGMELGELTVVPGFVDIHTHGGGGGSHPSGDPAQAVRAVDFHRRHGTTSTLASLVSAPLDDLVDQVSALVDLVTDGLLAGIHLEGPFLSQARRGAHDPAVLRDPEPAALDRLLAAGRGTVRMVTLAPERPGGLAAVRRLVDAGVVAAVGHTDASYQVTRDAFDAGASVATHLFNGMPPPHHREPGPTTAALEDPRVVVEAVNDGIHLHPATVRLMVAAAGPSRVALITDAMHAAGLGDGVHPRGRDTVEVRDGVARLGSNGSLAGSTLTMAAAFRRAVLDVGLPLPAAVRMAATTPARALGLAGVGWLAPGAQADLVVLDDTLRVHRVMARGRWLD